MQKLQLTFLLIFGILFTLSFLALLFDMSSITSTLTTTLPTATVNLASTAFSWLQWWDADDDDDGRGDDAANDDDVPADSLLRSGRHRENATIGDFDPAPRTTEVPYNEIVAGRRYFLYSPSGGLSNQLLEIGYALEIARLLNRSLLVPMIARHSSGWRLYERMSYADLFPADRILDFDGLNEYVHCVPLNISVEGFAEKFVRDHKSVNVRLVYHPHREQWTKSHVMGYLGSEKRKLIYLRGAEMYHPWFPSNYMVHVRRHIRFAENLRKRAVEIVNQAFPDRRFNAMHVRLADYSDRWGTFHERSRAILNKPLTERFGPNREKMDPNFPIYLASDEPHNGGFVELKKRFKVITFSQLPENLVEDFKNLFPKSRIRYDMMGVLEQLICAQSVHFSGTEWSTFSENIQFIRSSKAKLFPELLQYKRDNAAAGEPKQLRVL